MSARAEVKIYVKRGCPYCAAALDLLDEKGVRYEKIEVGIDPEKRRWLRQISGRSTVPQVFVNGQPLGGYSEISALDADGALDPVLAEPPQERR